MGRGQAQQATGKLQGSLGGSVLNVKALIALSENEENPNARNYYLSEALEITQGESL
ncbi:MAG: hypothetical protein QG552_2247, partial [Thermodesulfobacteriota bacterium]|nr:hypothetical protein [Thermodesulfobacteriota bacterium]